MTTLERVARAIESKGHKSRSDQKAKAAIDALIEMAEKEAESGTFFDVLTATEAVEWLKGVRNG